MRQRPVLYRWIASGSLEAVPHVAFELRPFLVAIDADNQRALGAEVQQDHPRFARSDAVSRSGLDGDSGSRAETAAAHQHFSLQQEYDLVRRVIVRPLLLMR